MIRVRDMSPADLEVVSRFAAQLVALHHGWDPTRFFTTPDVAEGYRRFLVTQLDRGEALLLTAEVDGTVAGYLYGSVEGRDWAKLLDTHGAVHDVFVSPGARRRGVGQALMREATARFQARGLQRVVLYAAPANTDGQALFKGLGFRPSMVEMTLDLR